MRSTSTSRCSSPMPAMIVWPVSSSEWTWNVGSSSDSACSARPQRAAVDTEVGELPDVGVAHDLEREGRERLVVARLALQLLDPLHVDALDRRQVERAGQEVDDRVEQRLHALVLERGATQHG